MTELNGRVAIITGASSGIGAATAKALEKQGVKVVLAGRSHDKLNTLAKDMNEDNIHIVPTDVTNQVEVDALVAKAIDVFGHVDIFVNCAGVMRSSKITDYQVESWIQWLIRILKDFYTVSMRYYLSLKHRGQDM